MRCLWAITFWLFFLCSTTEIGVAGTFQSMGAPLPRSPGDVKCRPNLILVVRIASVAAEGATNGNPPQGEFELIEALRGDLRPGFHSFRWHADPGPGCDNTHCLNRWEKQAYFEEVPRPNERWIVMAFGRKDGVLAVVSPRYLDTPRHRAMILDGLALDEEGEDEGTSRTRPRGMRSRQLEELRRRSSAIVLGRFGGPPYPEAAYVSSLLYGGSPPPILVTRVFKGESSFPKVLNLREPPQQLRGKNDGRLALSEAESEILFGFFYFGTELLLFLQETEGRSYRLIDHPRALRVATEGILTELEIRDR